MGSNSFGTIFKITTWGEAHGRAIGVVIDGCPAGLEISEEEIRSELARRRPGRHSAVSAREEKDEAEIWSGLFEGKTTGAPLSIIIFNRDANTSAYEPMKNLLRPGHANFTYLEKYGIFDYRGGGRASARETASRVAAGAVAKKLLKHFDIELLAYLKEAGGILAVTGEIDKNRVAESPIFCPDKRAEAAILQKIEEVKKEGDSIGGVVELIAWLPAGLGDPVFEKLEANLAKAMLTIHATKGVEFGEGFESARMKGSQHNDLFEVDSQDKVSTKTNHAGGTLGGISTGMPLVLRVAFKPTSSIGKSQQTLTLDKERATFELPPGSRHDPCVALRAPPVVEAMGALVIADALLLNLGAKL